MNFRVSENIQESENLVREKERSGCLVAVPTMKCGVSHPIPPAKQTQAAERGVIFVVVIDIIKSGAM